jgi:hypothetical protein
LRLAVRDKLLPTIGPSSLIHSKYGAGAARFGVRSRSYRFPLSQFSSKKYDCRMRARRFPQRAASTPSHREPGKAAASRPQSKAPAAHGA